MDTATLAPETPVETPVPAAEPAPVPEAPEEATSIRDHAETYQTERMRDDQGRFAKEPKDRPEPRHRATSSKATVDDVAVINDLTRQLRQKERELAAVRPDALSGSPRVLSLKRQIKALEAELGEATAPPKAAEPAKASETPKPAATTAPEKSKPAPAAFTEKEPKLEDFEGKVDDAYMATAVARAKWELKREAHEAEQKAAQERQQAEHNAVGRQHHERMAAFAAKTPDFQQVTAAFMQQDLPPTLLWAIVRDDNGPQHVYTLAKDPAFADELILLTDGKPVTDASVEIIRRRLNQRVLAAPTGSAAAPAKPVNPPRPPNPVRTGPTRVTDEPPDEAVSVAEHARYHGAKLRR